MVNCICKSLSSFYVKFSIVIIVLNLCIMYLGSWKRKREVKYISTDTKTGDCHQTWIGNFTCLRMRLDLMNTWKKELLDIGFHVYGESRVMLYFVV